MAVGTYQTPSAFYRGWPLQMQTFWNAPSKNSFGAMAESRAMNRAQRLHRSTQSRSILIQSAMASTSGLLMHAVLPLSQAVTHSNLAWMQACYCFGAIESAACEVEVKRIVTATVSAQMVCLRTFIETLFCLSKATVGSPCAMCARLSSVAMGANTTAEARCGNFAKRYG